MLLFQDNTKYCDDGSTISLTNLEILKSRLFSWVGNLFILTLNIFPACHCMLRIGIFGGGVVGGGVCELLQRHAARFRTLGVHIEVAKICVRDISKYQLSFPLPLLLSPSYLHFYPLQAS